VQQDELPGAPAAAVLGYELWRTRFGGDRGVVGREIRLGNVPYTVVGVMPDGFAFPVSQEAWVPLRSGGAPPAPREGAEIFAFGRLAPGATIESANAELATLGARMTAAYPATHSGLRPRAVPYTEQSLTPEVYIGFAAAQTLTILLLVVICVNIAVLVHARTAARAGEIAVRSALGASRARIVGQLFAEALVLSVGAALAGIALAGGTLAWVGRMFDETGGLSFWMDLGLSPDAVLYALFLAAASAVIVGVVPALKVTGRRLRTGLDQAGRSGGLRLGASWTTQIIAQVAVATAILPAATFSAWDQFRSGLARPEYAAEEFLTAHLAMEEGEASDERASRFEDRFTALTARLEADPAVTYVTFTKHSVVNTVPGSIVVEDLPRAPGRPRDQSVRTNEMDLHVFDAFDIPILEGRGFVPSDLAAGASPVIVNRAFVEEVLGGRNAVGRELRYTWRYGWGAERRPGTETDTLRRYKIVGVVGDQFVVGTDPSEVRARVFHPTTAGRLGGVTLAVRLRGLAPEDFAPRLRAIAAAVDPTLQLHDVLPLDTDLHREQRLYRFIGIAIVLVTLSVVLLSAAGIHALMSFTITRRRREIGIRAALGARPTRLLAGIFSRAAGQVAVGLAIGVVAATLLKDLVENATGGQAALFISAAAALMTVVGLLAALEPARRGLRVEPMEALRAD
jgi:predicted permease